MSDYIAFCAGLAGESDRVLQNEQDSMRKERPKRVQVSEEDKEAAKVEFENDFNVKEMP